MDNDGKYKLQDTSSDTKKRKLQVKEIVAVSQEQFSKLGDKEKIKIGPKITEYTEKIIDAREAKIKAVLPDYSKHNLFVSFLLHIFSFPVLIWSKIEEHQIHKLKETVSHMRDEIKKTSENWNPVLNYAGSTATPETIAITSENVITEIKADKPKLTMTEYNGKLGQITRDIKGRGENITLSYVKNGDVVNVNAKELLKRSSLADIAEEVISDDYSEKYQHILKSKPDGVGDKEYIVFHMLYLSSQNSFNQLGLTATQNGFTPSYGNDPKTKHSEFLVDFDSGKVGAAQVANGVGVGFPPKVEPAKFMVKLEFDCTKPDCNTPTTTIHIFEPGNFTNEQFQEGLSPSKK